MTDRNTRAPCTASELLLKVVLTGTQGHYESRGIIDDKRLEHLLHAGKQILYKSHQESDVRQNLGFSPAIWQGLTSVLSVAIPVLEQLCFTYKSPQPPSFNGTSSDLVAANCVTLIKEIERLNDLCTIARNLLATTKRAQNLAAEKSFDQQILKLIDVCVKVTARGFDGANVRAEERHQKVCNLFKRLLITCLQFLHNFIMHNEHRKLVLWLDLFGNSQQAEAAANAAAVDGPPMKKSSEAGASTAIPEEQAAQTSSEARIVNTAQKLPNSDQSSTVGANYGYNVDDVHALFDLMSMQTPPDKLTQNAAVVLMDKIRNDMERISGLTVDQLDDDPEALLKVGAALRAQLPSREVPVKQVANGNKSIPRAKAAHWSGLPDLSSYGSLLAEQEITEDDLIMPRTSESAAETLQEAKDELMARLQDTAPLPDDQDELPLDGGYVEGEVEDEVPESIADSMDEEEEEDDEEEDEDEDDDEDYHSPSDQERGLLTDVPLVLGPTEIEALPMIIQAGIVDNFGAKNNNTNNDRQGVRNMQAVRCHILLAQEAGRNVLRELLIFIAAWDLPDDEFYFKMMVQIMEAILKNGLMSHAYSDFGQAKDIISPAQAVVIKILTHIFRAKYSPSSSAAQNNNNNNDHHHQAPSRPRLPAPLSRVDVLTVRYIFTVFRGNIIPETCALIYLQGQIRAGLAMAEDFPLNLWDMERVYEGVYQFLEFFAVLTENNDWKRLLVEWEIVYDLVTLLKELDASIPKAPFVAPKAKNNVTSTTHYQSTTAQTSVQKSSSTTPALPAIPNPTNPPQTSLPLPPPPPPPPSSSQPSTTTTTTTQTPTQATSQATTTIPPSTPPPPTPTEDPSTFEWRNLKKLIVLVLSSLVWKSPQVQTQIREHSGVECVLSCTQYDGHNPYIKEHAVMCLKFLLEGSRENQGIVRELEARGLVDSNGGGNSNNVSGSGSVEGSGGGNEGGGAGSKAELEKMGLRAKIENGKVKIESILNHQQSQSQSQSASDAGITDRTGRLWSRAELDRLGLRTKVEGGRVQVVDGDGRVISAISTDHHETSASSTSALNRDGDEREGQEMGMEEKKKHRIARRASETNAAAELLGEKFAKLYSERNQESAVDENRGVPDQVLVEGEDDGELEFM